MWVQGNKLGTFAKAMSAPNCGVLSPALSLSFPSVLSTQHFWYEASQLNNLSATCLSQNVMPSFIQDSLRSWPVLPLKHGEACWGG